ncbi:phasin family protein [Polynucleobacter kasalickyi]|uniref:Phasin family protein n=2 Tax=Polynucleobacter kasalickyi TaxID=1938817 RepID=A0A1W2B204_9BURK|nr:phasin family protein [Polynucleobacter kasalickyi]
MVLTPEQIIAANKANLETLNSLTKNAFVGVEKLLELNLQVVKTVIHEHLEHIQATANVKDAQTLLSMQAQFLQPFAEKMTSYSRHLQNISNETQSAMRSTAQEEMRARSTNLKNLVSEISTTPPTSGEQMVGSIKQAIANANQVYEYSQQAIQQVIEISSQQRQTLKDTAFKVSEEFSKLTTKK